LGASLRPDRDRRQRGRRGEGLGQALDEVGPAAVEGRAAAAPDGRLIALGHAALGGAEAVAAEPLDHRDQGLHEGALAAGEGAELAAGGRDQDGLLVREVLVEGPHADPRALGDVIGVQRRRPAPLENLSGGLDDGLDGRARTRLLRATALKRREIGAHARRVPNASVARKRSGRGWLVNGASLMSEQSERERGAAIFAAQDVAASYHGRPPYAPALYAALLALTPARTRALDLGCGPGKVARVLADHFAEVVALDRSAAMLSVGRAEDAGRHPNIRWVEARAEDYGDEAGFDLVVAGASIHWFDPAVLFPKLARWTPILATLNET